MRTVTLLLAALPILAEYHAGIARTDITPKGSIWLSGYGGRNHTSEGALHPLWAKAVAISDGRGGRVVIVSTDLIGLPRAVSEQIAAAAGKAHGLPRASLVLNSSHTHTGPVVWPNLHTMFGFTPEQRRTVDEYTAWLTAELIALTGRALGAMQPVRLDIAHSTTDFAINRRQRAASGVSIGVNRQGPVDHDVPVIRITRSDGAVVAILFGYACHNTTLTGEFYKMSGDYAGFAQAEIERVNPGATALFLMLCGADQNPNPRSSLALAEQHGKALAGAVAKAMASPMKRAGGRLRTAFTVTELPFAPRSREDFEKELKDTNASKVRRAQVMLKAMDEKRPIRSTPYPVQAVRFGDQLTMVALGGEVVVDYSLNTKKAFPREDTIVLGYSNDVMCYIPNVRILREGGYEANDSMIYYGQPGPFTEEVEERVTSAIAQVMKRVGRRN
ncbi:MAG: hypothetical protein FJW40_00060 [Acidobacteria bacterium]|nr:hypothetical protein [Acidobacteriota bacterium]